MKQLVALKLHSDFDLLRLEFIKCFRIPYVKKTETLQAFYHWRMALRETFRKSTNIPLALNQTHTLFQGVNSVMCLDQYEGINVKISVYIHMYNVLYRHMWFL